eukprot:scaffold32133_cov31-Cyclotella_meneghiniana.AAC.1
MLYLDRIYCSFDYLECNTKRHVVRVQTLCCVVNASAKEDGPSNIIIQPSDDNTIICTNQRARAESTATAATDPSLSHDEKVVLMNSAFYNVHDDDSNDDDDDIVIPGIDVPDSHGAGEDSCDNNDDNDHHPKKKGKLSSLESKTSNSQGPRHHQQPTTTTRGTDNISTGENRPGQKQIIQMGGKIVRSELYPWSREPPKT